MFVREAYPVLLRDCGFPACHGAPERFFQVLGPGRTRYSRDGDEVGLFDPALPEEIEHSYNRARAMLAHEELVEESLLLRKPLAPSQGGAGHAGIDAWGQDVYPSAEDQGFETLYRWARSTSSDRDDESDESSDAGEP